MLRLARQPGRIAVVDDQFGAPTTSIEVANATREIVSGVMAGQFGAPENWAGLYHRSCSGSTSWCGFARAGQLLDGRSPGGTPIASAIYPTPAKHPRESVLSNTKLGRRIHLCLPLWEAEMDAVLQALTA
jgi:dTDP-4-dehydrorhamnose reductase